jgi:hypothetical protein
MNDMTKPPATLEDPKTFPGMLKVYASEIARALPKHMDGDRMARIALTEFRKNPRSRKCEPKSVFAAVVVASQLGLEPGVLGQAYLVPYKANKKINGEWVEQWECQLIPGWQGLADLVARAGRASVWTGAVFKGDEFDWGRATGRSSSTSRGDGDETEANLTLRVRRGPHQECRVAGDRGVEYRQGPRAPFPLQQAGRQALRAQGQPRNVRARWKVAPPAGASSTCRRARDEAEEHAHGRAGEGAQGKLWNEELAAAVRAKDLPASHYWQLEHFFLVNENLKRVIFTVSDGTAEKRVSMEYRPVAGRRKQLLAGWAQFDADVANYAHREIPVKPAAEPIRDLPTLALQVEGSIQIKGNLVTYGAALKAFVARIPATLETDQDFANAEAAVKALQKAQDTIEGEVARVLSQVKSVDDVRTLATEYVTLARTQRLNLEKKVETRKATIRADVLREGQQAALAHILMLNTQFGTPYMPSITAKFAEAMKGKKTVKGLRDAVDDELARFKIEANAIADKIAGNLNAFRSACEEHHEYRALFHDLGHLVLHDTEHFSLVVATRIEQHERATKERAERLAEEARARIRAEEEARAQAALAKPEAPSPIAPSEAVKLPSPTAEVVSIASARARPTDSDIIATLAKHYAVPGATVIDWLIALDLRSIRATAASQ